MDTMQVAKLGYLDAFFMFFLKVPLQKVADPVADPHQWQASLNRDGCEFDSDHCGPGW